MHRPAVVLQNVIYTYVGDILCAINPYKKIKGMYVRSTCPLYSHGRRAPIPCAVTGPPSTRPCAPGVFVG